VLLFLENNSTERLDFSNQDFQRKSIGNLGGKSRVELWVFDALRATHSVLARSTERLDFSNSTFPTKISNYWRPLINLFLVHGVEDEFLEKVRGLGWR
jgi:hypothetical protein